MPITYSGLFSGFDLEDVAALKRLSIALCYYRTSGLSSAKYDISAAIKREEKEMPINSLERSNIGEIWLQMNSKTLIREIIDKFMIIDINDSKALLAGGVQLRHFVDPLLDVWPIMGKEYTVEQEKFCNDLLTEWRSMYAVLNTPQPNNPRIARSSAALGIIRTAAESKTRQVKKPAGTDSASHVVPVPREYALVALKVEKEEPEKNCSSIKIEKSSSSPEPVNKTDSSWGVEHKKGSQRHTPLKKKGERIIEDGNIDFTHAKVGVEDLSKLHITLITEKTCPRTGRNIPGSGVNRIYGRKVKWDDVDSVRGLNQWRTTCLIRDFGRGWKLRPGRWLQMEKDWVLDFLKDRPCDSWTRLANAYHERFKGTQQDAGESFVRVPGREKEILIESRTAPSRTREAIERVVKFWPEYQIFIASASSEKNSGKLATVRYNDDDDILSEDEDKTVGSMHKSSIVDIPVIKEEPGFKQPSRLRIVMKSSVFVNSPKKKRKAADSDSEYEDEKQFYGKGLKSRRKPGRESW